MNDKQSSGWFEIGVYSVLLCVVASVFWSTLGLPASTREPLGSASLPQIVSVIIGIFCVILIWRALAAMRPAVGRTPAPNDEAVSHRRRTDKAAICLGIAIAFALALQLRLLNAAILTPAFLLSLMLVLHGFRPRTILPSVAISLIVGIVTVYAFKNFFYIDLP
ncbi:tripartite tricarboxylate transporter TctB family protein [Martelella mediterranea]|uniref:Tripartite tricarboxylate transporter TctB family protein n=1 Tax=Martelella mediterranea DSM 17316 TaxID=1122214 RepID=A0A1U9YZM7_9HYPH|nr:tripartite tricarboxylate transporter TctB family protein [Martelella mediterranea]AQZ50897.1 Tripartite tricarboxylate transporter TctB family protein [Martelella mediterranea DSM 17316]